MPEPYGYENRQSRPGGDKREGAGCGDFFRNLLGQTERSRDLDGDALAAAAVDFRGGLADGAG